MRRLGEQYRHLQQEHQREMPMSSTRRRLEVRMRRLIDRFEGVLAHWVHDRAAKERWHDHFYDGTPVADRPRLDTAPLFKGRTEAGGPIEVRAAKGGYDVILGGTVTEHVALPWRSNLYAVGPIQIAEHLCEEVFDAPDEAV